MSSSNLWLDVDGYRLEFIEFTVSSDPVAIFVVVVAAVVISDN